MSEVVKKFQFASSAEGWVANPVHANLRMYWHSSNRKNRPLPPVSTYGGALWYGNKRLQAGGESYWELDTTWGDLGLPVGKRIVTLRADYSYRFTCMSRHGNNGYAGVAETCAGPFTLHDSAGVLKHTLSTENWCPVEDIGSGYPVSLKGAIVEEPACFSQCNSEIIVIDPAIAGSGSEIKLRLYGTVPECPDYGRDEPARNVTVKFDRVVLTMGYDISVIAGVSTIQGISTITF